jgi:protein-tyrosine phosphatase
LAWADRARRIGRACGTLARRVTDAGQRLYWDLRHLFSRRKAPAGTLEPSGVRFRVLFVCFGNICRSPLAEEIFRHKLAGTRLAALVGVDSAGTSAVNVGKRPHWKTRACAARHGLVLGHLQARVLTPSDIERCDRILVMDRRNRQDVLRLASGAQTAGRVRLLLEFAGGGEIPDPIDGTAADFESVFRQIAAACDALIADVGRELDRRGATAAATHR